MELLSFTDALNKTTGKKHLLLGNGFSAAWRHDIFSYKTLLEQTDFSALSPIIPEIFTIFNTQDFEIIIRKLRDSSIICSKYNCESDHAKAMAADAEALKNALIQVLTHNHPEIPLEVSDDEYRSCADFLNKFDHIYTLNYDLLLYWTIMFGLDNNLFVKDVDDGFRESEDDKNLIVWDGGHGQNVYFLHGALHVYDDGGDFVKFAYSKTGIPLIDQIRQALNDGMYPHFVAEGTYQEKMKHISHSALLDKGRRSLKTIGGNLFIYGHSLADNDTHILRTIAKSKIINLFVSIYGEPLSDSNKLIMDRAYGMARYRKRRDELNVHFYDAASTHVWDKRIN